MQFARRQRLFHGGWKPLLVSLPVGLLLGFAGPFGSYPGFAAPTRYAFWLGLTIVGVATVLAADAVLSPARLRSHLLRTGAVALLSSVPMTFVVAWTISLIQAGRTYTPAQLVGLFWGVAAIQLLVVIATALASSKMGEEQPVDRVPIAPPLASQPTTPMFPGALLGKLPSNIGSDIMALETEDHYLRVHTSGGSALVLMRMADAVELLDRQLGAQVHRRWWVSGSSVRGVRMDKQKMFILLKDDRLVPVGRTFASAVRQRFALDHTREGKSNS